MYKYTDGGRAEAGISDRNDCAVRAYSIFKQVPYAEAHALFAAEGRRNGKGTPNSTITKLLGKDEALTEQLTLNQLRSQYPNHRVYALKRGHAFAVIGGVLYDSWKVGGKSRVYKYWITPMDASDSTPVEAPTTAVQPVAQVIDKKARALEIYVRLLHTGISNNQIAKRIATELNITVANASYYVTRVFNKYTLTS